MSPYDTLDSSWLKDLEDSKKGYETSIQSLKDKVNSKTREEGTENYIYVYSEDERRKMNGTIKDYNAIIEALDPLIEKVKGLDAVYSAAYGQLTDGFGDISKLESANSKLTPSPLVYYKPNA